MTTETIPEAILGTAYTLYCEDRPFGSGRRYLVVVSAGPKWITLINPVTLVVGKIHVDDWRSGKPVSEPVSPTVSADKIASRAAMYRRLEVPYAHKTVKAIVRGLRTG